MPCSLIVRPVSKTDFAQWKPLWDGYNAFYGRSGAKALPEAITEITWSRFLDLDEPVHAIVAETDGQILGFVHYLFHRNTLMIEPTCYLQDLFTAVSARGKGVGRALVEAVYQQANSAGTTSVYWHTHETNSIAMKLYDDLANKTGFVVYRK